MFTDNEPANARLATDGSSRLTKSEMWKDCANYLNTVVLDNIEKFGSYTVMITHGDASQKFRNLKKTYLQKKAKSRETGKSDELKAMRHYQAFSDLYRYVHALLVNQVTHLCFVFDIVFVDLITHHLSTPAQPVGFARASICQP